MAIFTKPIRVLLSEEQYRCLQKMAKEQNKSLSSVVRESVELLFEATSSEDVTMTESMGKPKLRCYQFYGMWKDRTDMPDGAEWVRRHRESWNERRFETGYTQ